MESLLVLLLIANLAGLFLIWQRQDKQENISARAWRIRQITCQTSWITALNKPDKPVSWIKRLGSGCQRPFARSAN